MKDAIVQDGKLVGGTARLRRYFIFWRPIGGGNTRQGVDLKEHSAFVVVACAFSSNVPFRDLHLGPAIQSHGPRNDDGILLTASRKSSLRRF